MYRECAKCGTFSEKEEGESKIHDHHIIPTRGWDGTDRDGIKLLCKRHHDILHFILLYRIGKVLKERHPAIWKEIRKEFKPFTEWWLEKS